MIYDTVNQLMPEIDKRQGRAILTTRDQSRKRPRLVDDSMSNPAPGKSRDRRVLTVLCNTSVITALCLAFFAPTVSQIFCSTACEGGQCDVPEPVAVCDLEAGGCCGAPSGDENIPPCVDLSVSRFLADCQPCSCFGNDEIGCFILARHDASGNAQTGLVTQLYVPSDGRQITVWASVMPPHPAHAHAHDPPIYRLTRALLI